MSIVLVIVFRMLEALFVIGVVGCVVAIPLAAYKMFSVLLEHDSPEA